MYRDQRYKSICLFNVTHHKEYTYNNTTPVCFMERQLIKSVVIISNGSPYRNAYLIYKKIGLHSYKIT